MRRILILILIDSFPFLSISQSSLMFRDLEYGSSIPKSLTSDRSAVIVNTASAMKNGFLIEGNWKEFCDQAHAMIYKMGVDAISYINQNDFMAGSSNAGFYSKILSSRSIKNLIFITGKAEEYVLICTAYNGNPTLINNEQPAYRKSTDNLQTLLLGFAKDIKRADYPSENFLIPEKSLFLDALPIVENNCLKNYPGHIRRSKLAVERFQKIEVPKNADEQLILEIDNYNTSIDGKNQEFESIMEQLPYPIEFIDYLSDEDLLRRRYQFVLRNVYATGESIRMMLKYDPQSSETAHVSVVPIMPDHTSIKMISKKALVHKFYIRQNISKNVYVGVWDADSTWQNALQNYIGNMIQYFDKGN